MNTQIIKDELDAAAELLRRGELVAVPTETVYGLAGNGLDEQAVHDIYEVKGRPERKPLSLMVPDAGAMARYCEEIPEQAYALAERFWPGPLTIVLKAKDSVPEIVRAGGETVGLRCPDHPLTLALLKKAQIPFAAPSANPSGAPSPKTAEEVKGYFDGKIAAIVDGGPCGLGKESTLLLMTTKPYRVLRQGALPAEAIADALVEHMTILGITGGSGGGKTTALREIQRQGGLVLDCDAVYHELLARDRELIEELDARFPGCVTDGMLDRRALGRVVFSDAEALKDLPTAMWARRWISACGTGPWRAGPSPRWTPLSSSPADSARAAISRWPCWRRRRRVYSASWPGTASGDKRRWRGSRPSGRTSILSKTATASSITTGTRPRLPKRFND